MGTCKNCHCGSLS